MILIQFSKMHFNENIITIWISSSYAIGQFLLNVFRNYTKETLVRNIRTMSKEYHIPRNMFVTLILAVAIGNPVNSQKGLPHLLEGRCSLIYRWKYKYKTEGSHRSRRLPRFFEILWIVLITYFYTSHL